MVGCDGAGYRERGENARFVVSLCWGAFVLARAGLLEDRACTTFPTDYQRFAETFPSARLAMFERLRPPA